MYIKEEPSKRNGEAKEIGKQGKWGSKGKREAREMGKQRK